MAYRQEWFTLDWLRWGASKESRRPRDRKKPEAIWERTPAPLDHDQRQRKGDSNRLREKVKAGLIKEPEIEDNP